MSTDADALNAADAMKAAQAALTVAKQSVVAASDALQTAQQQLNAAQTNVKNAQRAYQQARLDLIRICSSLAVTP